jgi:hypothetical protein
VYTGAQEDIETTRDEGMHRKRRLERNKTHEREKMNRKTKKGTRGEGRAIKRKETKEREKMKKGEPHLIFFQVASVAEIILRRQDGRKEGWELKTRQPCPEGKGRKKEEEGRKNGGSFSEFLPPSDWAKIRKIEVCFLQGISPCPESKSLYLAN